MVQTRARPEAPQKLVRYANRWTGRFENILNGLQGGDWATRIAKKTLADALSGLAHSKCVYCESALGVTVDLEVDHYVAKTVAPRLAFNWTNLLPSCRRCNRPKLNHDHANVLLQPDVEDPEPFFWIHPDTGRLEPHPTLDDQGMHRATETIRLCDLQRAALCTQRLEMFGRVNRWLKQVSNRTRLGRPLLEEWESLTNPVTEYKFVLRHALELHGQLQLAELDRQRFRDAVS
jgi:uncharacterized protein (TIGR02646 family)